MSENKDKPTIETVLKENQIVRSLYNMVLDYLQSLGSIKTVTHKTQISFGGQGIKTYFAFIWIPYWINKSMPENTIILTIDLPEKIINKRIREAVEVRKGRWTHHIPLAKQEDFDNTVKKWLSQSYEFGKTGLRK